MPQQHKCFHVSWHFNNSRVDFETASYIVNSFPRLLTANEAAALRHYLATFKIGTPDAYNSLEAYETKLNWWKEGNYISEDPDVLNLLANGLNQFYIETACRIAEQTPEKVYFNYCPNCKMLARTPYARQCKHCGHSWHDTIGANFKMNKIFELISQPKRLFFAGDLKSGSIKEGMKIDLTFLGVSIKPTIESIAFLDAISEGKADVTLGVGIENDEDREYLKKRGVLAIPIIIERQNAS
jgi:hypothetical protein